MLIPPEAFVLIGAIVLLAVAPFVAWRKPGLVTQCRFWVMGNFVVVFALRPLFILLRPEYAHHYIRRQPEFPQLVVGGLCLALAGLAVFWVGYFLRAGRRLGEALPLLPQDISPARWRQAVLACLLIGLLCYLILLRTMGGLQGLLSVLYMRAAAYEADETAGPMKELAKLIGGAAVLGMYYHIRIKRAWWAWPLLVLSSGVVATMGGRGAVVGQWTMTYVLYALTYPRYRSWKFLVAVGLGVLVFATVALGARRATRGGVGAVAQAARDLPATLTGSIVDAAPHFDQMVAALQVAGREVPYREGSSYAELIPIMVPRALWPVQTETVGVTLRKAIDPDGLGGRPSTAMGEGYLNFGLVGALVPMLFLGIWCRGLETYLARSQDRSLIAPLLYAFAVFSTGHLTFSVGPLAVRYFLFRLAPALAAFAWSARTRALSPVEGSEDAAAGSAAA